jgi:hypothetical protein
MKQPSSEFARERIRREGDLLARPASPAIRRQRLAISLFAAMALILALAPLAAGLEAARKDVPNECVSCDPIAVPSKDFCEWWKGLGTLYSNPENPYIQEFKFLGRLHYQYGIVDGEGAGNEVNYETDELRRFRAGVSSKFLDYWDLYAEAEISDDQRPRGGDLDIRFQHMWQLKTHFDAKKAFDLDGIDGLKFGIGSREINMSYEWVTSSKRIKTVERSAIANKIWAFNSEFANPTGAWVITELKPITWTFGVFSTTQDDWIAPFDDGELYYSNVHWDAYDGPNGEDTDVRWTAFYQDRSGDDEVLAGGLDWATALSAQHKQGPWEVHVEGIAGNNGNQSNADREGNFWAAVFMPSYWILDDSLEAVARFQYQGSDESQGIRLNSRYVRRAGSRENLPTFANGRGDEHYSIYAGLSKLLCGHQHKVMFGVEYDSLHRDGNELFRGWTAFTAYRTYW